MLAEGSPQSSSMIHGYEVVHIGPEDLLDFLRTCGRGRNALGRKPCQLLWFQHVTKNLEQQTSLAISAASGGYNV